MPGQDERRKLPTRPLRGAESEGGGGAASIEGRVCVRAWRSMSEGRRKVLLLVEKAKVVKDDSGEEDEEETAGRGRERSGWRRCVRWGGMIIEMLG